MTANLDQRTINALSTIATPDEIAGLLDVLDRLSRGHAEEWMARYIAEIITRLTSPQNAPKRSQNES